MPQNGSYSPAAGALNIVQKDGRCVSEKITSFVIEIADVVLRVLRMKDQLITLELVDFLVYSSLKSVF